MTDPCKTTNAQQLGKQVYLTGYRGSGKTSVARVLASRIGMSVVDLDAEVILAAGKTIAEIFLESGEESFRDWETQCLTEASARPPAIISLGGGAVMRPENRTLIKESGVCVWLDADPMIIVARLAKDDATASQRPDLTGLPMAQEVRNLMEARRPVYDKVSDLRIDTSGLAIDDVAGQIAKWLTLPNKG